MAKRTFSMSNVKKNLPYISLVAFAFHIITSIIVSILEIYSDNLEEINGDASTSEEAMVVVLSWFLLAIYVAYCIFIYNRIKHKSPWKTKQVVYASCMTLLYLALGVLGIVTATQL